MAASSSHYTIAIGHTIGELESRVTKMIDDGWIPAGGLMWYNQRYLQAMWRPPMPKDIRNAMEKAKIK